MVWEIRGRIFSEVVRRVNITDERGKTALKHQIELHFVIHAQCCLLLSCNYSKFKCLPIR